MFRELIIGWMFPGACFIMKKKYLRGAFFFIILNLTFLLGVFLKGSVITPVFNPNSEGFNIVNLLTFFVQIGNGFFSAISLAASEYMLRVPSWQQESASRIIRFLSGQESYAYFDIASFFMLVSGAMNYFVVTNFYDQYYKKKEEK